MKESEWVKMILPTIQTNIQKKFDSLYVIDGKHLPYTFEILSYKNDLEPVKHQSNKYETDILIYEKFPDNTWKPRIIIETKIDSVTTHDSITYSQKAQTHKNVHPYLRYGILIVNNSAQPLPGRLFRHGQHFDFMISWTSLNPDKTELDRLNEILIDEIKSSRTLE